MFFQILYEIFFYPDYSVTVNQNFEILSDGLNLARICCSADLGQVFLLCHRLKHLV